MKKDKLTVFIVMTAFIISITACAGVPVNAKTGDKKQQPQTAKQEQFEQQEQTRALFVKGGGTFAGLLIGGLTGLLTAPKSNAVTSTLIGCAAGGAIGFVLGMIIFDSTKPGLQKADDAKVKEYFQEYKYIQLEK